MSAKNPYFNFYRLVSVVVVVVVGRKLT